MDAALTKMEAHIFDAGHFLLETHAPAAVSLILDLIGAAHLALGGPSAC